MVSENYIDSKVIYISILAVDYRGNYTIENLSYTLQSDRVSLKNGDMVTYYPDFGSYTYTRSDGTEGTIKLTDESISTDVEGLIGYALEDNGPWGVFVPISTSNLTRYNSTSVFELRYINLEEMIQNVFSYSDGMRISEF